jgi:2EXR family
MTCELEITAPASFTVFSKLPKELRCIIWTRSAPIRPRVIQLFYESTTNTWHAWKDGCGGLPLTRKVSREAREEALKGYTEAFDTFVNFEEDIIFISDPVFVFQKPIRSFLGAKFANQVRHLAITSEMYLGLVESAVKFPALCFWPPTILQKLKGLTHFTLVLSEDEMSLNYLIDDHIDDHIDDSDSHDTDWDDSTSENEVDISNELGPREKEVGAVGSSNSTVDNGVDYEAASRLRRRLARLEKEALANMSNGYVRHPGNIHFESAMESGDYWEDWYDHKMMIVEQCEDEKAANPHWVRPKLSIMLLRYGLKRLGDFHSPVHHQGDYSDVELEDSEFPPDESDSGSVDELVGLSDT